VFDAEGHDVTEFELVTVTDEVAVWQAVREVVELVVPQFEVDMEKLREVVGEFVEVAETHPVLVLDSVILVDRVKDPVGDVETVPDNDGEEVDEAQEEDDTVTVIDVDGEALLLPVASNAVALEVSETE
jgi:hypothetical protein